jgi:chromosome segregation ATPase
MDEIKQIEKLLSNIENDISEIEEILSVNKKKKKPQIIVKESNNRKNRTELSIEEINSLLYNAKSLSDNTVLILQELKELYQIYSEYQTKLAEIFANLEKEMARIDYKRNELVIKVTVIKQHIETIQQQVKRLMNLIEKIPDTTDEYFERKLLLIDRANILVDRITDILMKFLVL